MEKKYIDLAKLSEQIGCVFEDVEVKPGVVIRQTHWTKADYQTAKAAIREKISADPDASLAIYGSPDPWNTVALVKELGVRYVYPWPEHSERIELDLSPLAVGLPEDNYDVRFEIREEGERLFLNMTSDNPDLPRGEGTPHTFRLENVTKVHVPEIPAGKDVYLHAWGMYSVMCAVAATLAESARSVFLASHETDYFCCATRTPEHEIGDSEKRTWENTLPHC